MPDRIDLLPEKLLPDMDGPTLRTFRDMSDITQREMASRLKISTDTLRKWEQGRKPMVASQVARYAAALGLVIAIFDRSEYNALYGERERLRQKRLKVVETSQLHQFPHNR